MDRKNETEYSLAEFARSEELATCFAPKELLYHYTSTSAFDSILRHDKSDKMYFRASRIDLLNDRNEELDLKNLFEDICKQMLKDNTLSQEFSEEVKKAFTEREREFLFTRKICEPEWTGTNDYVDCLTNMRMGYDRYVTCFSLDDDSLPMWNYYNQNGRYNGINMGLNASMLDFLQNQAQNGYYCKLLRVMYEEKDKRRLLKNLILECQRAYFEGSAKTAIFFLAKKLDEWCCCFKSPFFMHEKEVRLVCDIPKSIPENSVDAKIFNVNYRESNGLFIPYILIDIPKFLLQTVRMGPLLGQDKKEEQKEIIKDMLASSGYTNIEVHASGIPIRY